MTRTVRVRLEVEAAGARREVQGFGSDLRKLESAVGATGKSVGGAGAGLRNLGTESAKASQHVGGLSSVVQKLGVGGGVGMALGGLGAVEVARKIVGSASDLNETMSKSQQVFKGSAGGILQWSKTSETALGMSRQAALEGASSFQNLFSQIGLTGKASVGMSTSLVKLASDFASFQNAAPEEVMDALLSATRGEYDALQRFVPTVNAAAIQTRALADSGKASASALTDAEKATALYELVTEGAGAATGDFARTAGGAANQQRIFRAEIEDTAASVGSVVLPAYAGVLQTVNAVGPGTLIAAAGVALLSNRLAASAKDGDGFVAAIGEKFRTNIDSSRASGERFAGTLGVMRTAGEGLRGAASGIVGLFGGPWGLALTAATIGIGLLTSNMAKNRAATEAAADAYVRLGEAAQDATTREQVQNLIKNDEAVRQLAIDTDKYGISTATLVDAAKGSQAAINELNNALVQRREELSRTMAEHVIASAGDELQFDKTGDAAKRERDKLDDLQKTLGEGNAKRKEAAAAAELYADAEKTAEEQTGKSATATSQYAEAVSALGSVKLDAAAKGESYSKMLSGLGDLIGSTKERAGPLTAAFDAIANSELNAQTKADLLRESWKMLYQPQIDVTDATENFNAALLGLDDQLDKGSRSLDINKEAGINNRNAVEALIQKNNDLYFANIAAGMSAENAAKLHDENAGKIEKAGQKAHLTTGDVHGLIQEYGQVPKTAVTDVRATGVDKVFEDLRSLKIAQIALEKNISVSAATSEFRLSHQTAGAAGGNFAAGGPVYGPGGPTEDMVKAVGPGGARYRLSAREWIQPVASVDYYGAEIMEAIRTRTIPRELLSPQVLEALNDTIYRPRSQTPGDGSQGVQFARGGQVWPFRVDASKTKIPVPQATAESANAMKFLRAQDGAPYVWAAAGPGGYDCSGIVSAVYNVLHGRSPYSHTFSTFNEAGYFPKPGFGAPLTAGWANPGERGGGDVGHTAGVLVSGMTAVPFESGGGWGGVHVGQGATPVGSFAHMGHFAGGGQVPDINLTFNLHSGGPVDGTQFSRGLVAAVKQYVNSAGGGNVQVAFGRRGS